jgi:hypothetical protein
VLAAALAASGINGADAQTKPTMTATLVDADKKAAEAAATVDVTTTDIQLVDPAISKEQPVPGQGHLHYQVDSGPVVATPSPKLTYHELAPGPHTIVVMLVGNDHKPLGPQERLTLTVPASAADKVKSGY